jgi:hypothetical protein
MDLRLTILEDPVLGVAWRIFSRFVFGHPPKGRSDAVEVVIGEEPLAVNIGIPGDPTDLVLWRMRNTEKLCLTEEERAVIGQLHGIGGIKSSPGVLGKLHGIGGKRDYPIIHYGEIAESMGLSVEEVKEIETRAVEKIVMGRCSGLVLDNLGSGDTEMRIVRDE